jgi:hypothetical protein
MKKGSTMTISNLSNGLFRWGTGILRENLNTHTFKRLHYKQFLLSLIVSIQNGCHLYLIKSNLYEK